MNTDDLINHDPGAGSFPRVVRAESTGYIRGNLQRLPFRMVSLWKGRGVRTGT